MKTHCPQEHPYDDKNTYIDSRGYRHCKTCRRERMAARRPNTGVGSGGVNAAKTHCPQGHEYTPENTFYIPSKTSRSGKARACRECNRLKLRVANVKRYGLTPQKLADRITAQGGGCGICGREFQGRVVRRNIDHDHSCCPAGGSCGRCVRGILCVECNHGLGRFHDDPDLLEAAAQYLRTYSADPALRC